jgi:hypothetical protein
VRYDHEHEWFIANCLERGGNGLSGDRVTEFFWRDREQPLTSSVKITAARPRVEKPYFVVIDSSSKI